MTNANLFCLAFFHIQWITTHNGVIPLTLSFRNCEREAPDRQRYESRQLVEGTKE